jgi:hypothetical protein
MTNHMRILMTAALLSVGLAAYSQTNPNLEQGFQPFGTYDQSSFDSISATSHNLIVNIPLFNYPQRGALDEQLKIYYTNKNYIVKVNCTNSDNCVAFWSYNTTAPGGLKIMMDDGSASVTSKTFKDSHGILVTTYTATTKDGAVHQLTGSVHGGYGSIDATGIWKSTWVYDRRGNFGPTPLNDTNGNFASSTDTLGRSLSGTTSAGDTSVCRGPLPVTGATIISYPGPGGTSRQIQVCNATITVSTHFAAWSVQYSQSIREITNTGAGSVQSVIAYDGQSWATS